MLILCVLHSGAQAYFYPHPLVTPYYKRRFVWLAKKRLTKLLPPPRINRLSVGRGVECSCTGPLVSFLTFWLKILLNFHTLHIPRELIQHPILAQKKSLFVLIKYIIQRRENIQKMCKDFININREIVENDWLII